MPKPLRYLFIVLALLGLAFAIWTGIPRRSRAAEEAVAPQAAGPEGEDPAATPLEFRDQPVERTETASDAPAHVEPASDTDDASADATARATVGVATLSARFVDTIGNPWPGVLVVDPERKTVSATSDSNGRITLEVPQPWDVASWSGEFLARRAGCATQALRCTLTIGVATQLGDVVLGPGVDVLGRAVDEQGRGVRAKVGIAPGALDVTEEARLRRWGAHEFDRALAVDSGADGAFRIEGVAPGEWRLWAKGPDTRHGWTDTFTLVEGADARGLEVVVPALREADLITGIVLTPDGQPVKRARLSYSFATESRSSSTGTMAGEDGRFRIVVELDEASYDLQAGDPGNRFSDATLRGVKPGARDVELRLGKQQPFYVTLHGPEGEPVNECSMMVHRELREGHWSGASIEPNSKGDGRYELVVPASRFLLEIEAKGYRKQRTGELEPPAPGSTLAIRLSLPDFVRGRVLAGGKPAAGAKVRSFKDVGDATLEVNGFRCLHDAWGEAETTTKGDGTFELPYEDEGLLWVRAELAGYAAAEVGPLAPSNAAPLEFTLVRGGVIEGVVILPDGADAGGTIVGVSRGDGLGRTQRAGAGGRFRFEGLTPGPWQVLHRDQEIDPQSTSSTTRGGATPIEWSCEVRDGRTTRFDLDLSRP